MPCCWTPAPCCTRVFRPDGVPCPSAGGERKKVIIPSGVIEELLLLNSLGSVRGKELQRLHGGCADPEVLRRPGCPAKTLLRPIRDFGVLPPRELEQLVDGIIGELEELRRLPPGDIEAIILSAPCTLISELTFLLYEAYGQDQSMDGAGPAHMRLQKINQKRSCIFWTYRL